MSRRKRSATRPPPQPETPAQAPVPVLAMLGLVWIIGGIGITIWAWGSWHGFLQSSARWGALAAFVVYSVGVLLSPNSGWSRGRREDEHNRWIILPLTLLGALLVWLPPYSDS